MKYNFQTPVLYTGAGGIRMFFSRAGFLLFQVQ